MPKPNLGDLPIMSASITDIKEKSSLDKTHHKRKTKKRSKRSKRKPARAAPGAAERIERPFPRVTLEDALRVPTAIKEKNGGNPYASEYVDAALLLGTKSSRFFYLSA